MNLTFEEKAWMKENGHNNGGCGPIAISRAFNIRLQDAFELAISFGYDLKDGSLGTEDMEYICKLLNPATKGVVLLKNRNWEDFSKEVNARLKETNYMVAHKCSYANNQVIQVRHRYACEYCYRYPTLRGKTTEGTISLTRFMQANPTGIFICHINGHYVVVREGKLVDPNIVGRTGKLVDKRKVIQYWKVG